MPFRKVPCAIQNFFVENFAIRKMVCLAIHKAPLTRLARQFRRWFGWQNHPHSTASGTSSHSQTFVPADPSQSKPPMPCISS